MSDDDGVQPPPKPRNPHLVAAAAFVAAFALAFSCFSSRWLANAGSDGEIMMGLRSTTECGSVGILLGPKPDECRTEDNSAYAEEWRGMTGQYYSASWAPFGTITTIAVLLGALGLFGAGVLGLSKTKPNLPLSPSTVALLGIMISLITGCVFVATKPGPGGFVGVGVTFWIFGIGAVIGIFVATVLAKLNRPVDPDLMDDAMNPDQF
ncbi:MAG: hypothetical protein ABI591_04750 [Kofleriaceae bacterium]